VDVGEALRRRRMVRRFTGEPLTESQIEAVAGAVPRAPTAGNAQGITVVAVTGTDRIESVADACGEAEYVARGFDPWLSKAGLLLALCAEPQRYRDRYTEDDKDLTVLDRIPWWWVDAGAALMAVLLAAVDAGLGAGFHGGHRADRVNDLLGIPDDVILVGVVAVGHPAPDRRSSSLDRPKRTDTVRRQGW